MTNNSSDNDHPVSPTEAGVGQRNKRRSHQKVVDILHSPFAAWVVLFCGLLTTLFAWKHSTDALQQQIELRFNTSVDEVTLLIEQRMLVYEQLLWGGVALFNSSTEVTRKEWGEYIRSLKIDRHWKGIQGLGFSIPLHKNELPFHIAKLRTEGLADYTISPPGDRNEYTAIIYLEPLDWRNRRAIGYDMWSNTLRRQAMQRARDTGNASTSAVIELVQETDSDIQKGFLTYVPVYRNGVTPATQQQRRELFEGWVYAAFRTGDLMQGILGKRKSEIKLQIFDGTTQTDSHLLFDSGHHIPEKDVANIAGSPLRTQRELKLQGHNWTLQFESRNTPISKAERNQPNIIAAAGLIFYLLLFYILSSLARANAIREKMTSELHQAKRELEHKVRQRTFALEQERSRLEQHVSERTEQLREKVSESEALIAALTDTNENLRQFSYVASHDLKEPLRMVVSFTELLSRKYADKLDETGRQYITIAADSGTRMQKMIEDLLQYTRLDDNSGRIHKVDCKVELDHVFQDFEDAICNHQIEIILNQLPVIRCNASRFLSVMKNLVGNSIKYGKTDGMTSIRVGAVQKNAEWIFTVADNGIGIEEKFHQRIFEPFKRLHSHNEFPGTGLGLAICKKIVVSWGGRIWLESRPNVGTTFYFSVPKKVALQRRQESPAVAMSEPIPTI